MKNFTPKYLAALLSMQETTDKINLYSKTARKNNVKILHPDINLSNYDFTEVDGSIIYGMKSIKGVGEASIKEIIKCRPYNSLEDCLEKVPKKYSNKRVMIGLILSGAFDFENENRFALINELFKIRKIKYKKDDKIDEEEFYRPENYNKEMCIKVENEYLGTSITNELWWDSINDGEQFQQTLDLLSVSTRPDKNNHMMAFLELGKENVKIKGLVFSSLYKKISSSFDINTVQAITIVGKKDKNNIIVNAVIDTIKKDMPEDNYDEDDDLDEMF